MAAPGSSSATVESSSSPKAAASDPQSMAAPGNLEVTSYSFLVVSSLLSPFYE
jgi:hypothetical protein